MFTVDGVQWNLPCDITRSIRIQDSDISGQMLNGQYFHDVEGTYYDYTVKLVPNPHQMGEYYSLFEILSQPVEGHAFVFPYNGSTVQVTAKVEDPEDIWVRMPNGGVYWRGLQFKATANGPTKTLTLQQAINRGLTPLPDVYDAEIGDTYTFTADGWVETEGGDVTVVPLSVTANGSYTAPTGQAYSPVTVSVPGGGEPSVPSDYQEVAYLQCTDYQCVTLDITPRGKVISVDVSQDALSSSESGFAGYYENASAVVEMYFKSGAIIIYSQSPSIDKNLIDTAVAGTRYSVAFVFMTNTTAINIGCYRTDRYPFAGKLYRAEVRDDNSGVHMLLKPCYRMSDSEPGFYDVINDVFYTNTGSGAFTVGPNV